VPAATPRTPLTAPMVTSLATITSTSLAPWPWTTWARARVPARARNVSQFPKLPPQDPRRV